MTRWIEDPAYEAPEGFRWMKPAPDDCPHCECHTARVCTQRAWDRASAPMNADGSPYLESCPCRDAIHH